MNKTRLPVIQRRPTAIVRLGSVEVLDLKLDQAKQPVHYSITLKLARHPGEPLQTIEATVTTIENADGKAERVLVVPDYVTVELLREAEGFTDG